MSLSIILKIAGVGILVGILHTILKESGKEQYSFYVTIAGLIIVFTMVLNLISQLFDSVKTIFQLY